MTMTLIAIAALLLTISALLTALGTAVFSLGSARLRTLVSEGFQGAGALSAIRARRDSVITLIHLGPPYST